MKHLEEIFCPVLQLQAFLLLPTRYIKMPLLCSEIDLQNSWQVTQSLLTWKHKAVAETKDVECCASKGRHSRQIIYRSTVSCAAFTITEPFLHKLPRLLFPEYGMKLKTASLRGYLLSYSVLDLCISQIYSRLNYSSSFHQPLKVAWETLLKVAKGQHVMYAILICLSLLKCTGRHI